MVDENQPNNEQPAVPQYFDWEGLPKDTKASLENILDNAPLPLLGQLSQLEKRAQQGEPEAQQVYNQALGNLIETLKSHYKVLNLTGQDLDTYVAENFAALKDPQKQNHKTAKLILKEIGHKLFNSAPQGTKDGLAQKAYESQFEQHFQAKLSDAWAKGSLIDTLAYSGLAEEQQAVFEEALKTGKSPITLLQLYTVQVERAKKEQNAEVQVKLMERAKSIKAEIEKYNVAVVKAYGFSDEFANHVKENPVAAQLLQPLFNLAAKKVALTLSEEKAKEVKDFHLQQSINAAYGAPQATEDQAS